MSKDLDLLQGAWSVAALEMDGKTMTADTFGDAGILVDGDRFKSTGMGAVYEGTLKVDTSKSPARIDMLFDAGPEKGNTNLGIYEFDGDSWKLCLGTRGTVRPTKFESKPASGIALETLVRGKAAKAGKSKAKAKEDAPSGPPTEFEGEWQLLSGVMSGAAMSAFEVQWVKRLTRGNQTTVTAGPQTMLKVEFTYDPAQSPMTIDYLGLAGSVKGKQQKGIYKVEGDAVTFCVAPPGADRPADFTSVKGDGRTLTAWKKI